MPSGPEAGRQGWFLPLVASKNKISPAYIIRDCVPNQGATLFCPGIIYSVPFRNVRTI